MMITRINGNYFGHPNVTVDYRPDGPVVVHDRRGSWEEKRRSRFLAGISASAGLILIGLMLNRIVANNGRNLGAHSIVILLIAGLSLATTHWLLVGRGLVEIRLTNGKLQLRALPINFGHGVSIEQVQISYLQVEKDDNWCPGRYRVQIVDLDGGGILPSLGLLSAIRTQDEASALASAIAQQFQFSLLSGLQTAVVQPPPHFERLISRLNREKEVEHFLPAKSYLGLTEGSIRIEHSDLGTQVIYGSAKEERNARLIFAIIWLLFFAFISVLSTDDPPPLLILAPFWIAGIAMIASAMVGPTIIYRDEGYLGRRNFFGPLKVRDEKFPIRNITRVGTVVAWDEYNSMYHRVMAQSKVGEDFVIISNLPESDGHALVQALHENLGLPIQVKENSDAR